MSNHKRSIFRSFLMMIGGLIMLLSGTCSALFFFDGMRTSHEKLELLFTVGIFGGIPFGVGYLIFVAAKGKSR